MRDNIAVFRMLPGAETGKNNKKRKGLVPMQQLKERIVREGKVLPGNIIKVLVKEGEKVEANQPIAVIEAMKMETNILAAAAGTVERIYVSEGQQVKAGEMVAKLK